MFTQEITRVLLNLISNGFYAVSERRGDSCPGFEAELRASTRTRGEHVEIRIRDNGAGIPPEVKEKMFHPWELLPSGRRRLHLGMCSLPVGARAVGRMFDPIQG